MSNAQILLAYLSLAYSKHVPASVVVVVVVVVVHHFQTYSPLKPLGQSKQPPWEGGMKVYINGPGHLTKMAAMPIYCQSLKNLLLENRKSYDLETWHVASRTQALQSLYK